MDNLSRLWGTLHTLPEVSIKVASSSLPILTRCSPGCILQLMLLTWTKLRVSQTRSRPSTPVPGSGRSFNGTFTAGFLENKQEQEVGPTGDKEKSGPHLYLAVEDVELVVNGRLTLMAPERKQNHFLGIPQLFLWWEKHC